MNHAVILVIMILERSKFIKLESLPYELDIAFFEQLKDPNQLIINGDNRKICGFNLDKDGIEWIASFSIFDCSIDPVVKNRTIEFPINIQRNLFISHYRSHFDIDLVCKFDRMLHVSTGNSLHKIQRQP